MLSQLLRLPELGLRDARQCCARQDLQGMNLQLADVRGCGWMCSKPRFGVQIMGHQPFCALLLQMRTPATQACDAYEAGEHMGSTA